MPKRDHLVLSPVKDENRDRELTKSRLIIKGVSYHETWDEEGRGHSPQTGEGGFEDQGRWLMLCGQCARDAPAQRTTMKQDLL